MTANPLVFPDRHPEPENEPRLSKQDLVGPNWVAYVGPFRYPWGEAASRRVHGIALSIAATGRNVIVACGETSSESLTQQQSLPDPGGTIYWAGMGELPKPTESALLKAKMLYLDWGRQTVRWLDSQPSLPSHVILYGGNLQYVSRLLAWSSRTGVPVIVDVVEWYSPRQLKGGLFGPAHLGSKLALTQFYPKCAGIIAISSMLERYYRRRVGPVVRIPPTFDVQAIDLRRRLRGGDRSISLIYTGTPGKKDLLGTIVAAVATVDPFGDQVKLRVVGPTTEQVLTLAGCRQLPPGVVVSGRLPQHDVEAALQDADFSVLLREPAKFAQAGFPTKFAESMANGVPVISNLTSDLELYLNDRVNGFVSEGHSEGAFAAALRAATNLSDEDRRVMRRRARQRAVESFDYRRFIEPLDDLLALTGA